MRQALEAKSLLNPSSLSPDSASPTTTLQLKHNLSTSAEADTEDGDDGSVNELPKPRTSSLFHLNPPPKKTHLPLMSQAKGDTSRPALQVFRRPIPFSVMTTVGLIRTRYLLT
jgi:hypothetical protein